MIAKPAETKKAKETDHMRKTCDICQQSVEGDDEADGCATVELTSTKLLYCL